MIHTPALAEINNDIDPGPPTTTLIVQPFVVDGNPTCADILPPDSFWFEFKIDPPASGTFPIEQGGLTGSVSVVIYQDTLGDAFDFLFAGDFVTSGVIAKGGSYANFYDYRPFNGAPVDTYLHTPINPSNNKFFGLSHISFCIIEIPATPTPTPVDPTPTPVDPTPTPVDPTPTPVDPTPTPVDPTPTPVDPTPTPVDPTPTPVDPTPTPVDPTPTPVDPTPTPVDPTPTPVDPTPTPVEPTPTNTVPPAPIIDTPTPTPEEPQPSPDPTSTEVPPGPPAVTATNTPPPTLAPPQQPVTTPVLIPVTGVDLGAATTPLNMLQHLLVNVGISLLGLAMVFYGISTKFEKTLK